MICIYYPLNSWLCHKLMISIIFGDSCSNNLYLINKVHLDMMHTNYNLLCIICMDINIFDIVRRLLQNQCFKNKDFDMMHYMLTFMNSNSQQKISNLHIKLEMTNKFYMEIDILNIEIDISNNTKETSDKLVYKNFDINTFQDNKKYMLLKFQRINNIQMYIRSKLIHFYMLQVGKTNNSYYQADYNQ